MPLKQVTTDAAPAAIGPYSQAIEAGNMLFVSGQIPLVPATGELAGDDIESQTRQVLANLCAVLAARDLTPADVVRCDVFLADMGDFAAMNALYAETFSGPTPPARQTIAAKTLPKNVLVEIGCIAYLGD